MSAKHEKAISDLRTERFDAAEATALQAGTPAFQSHPPSARNQGSRDYGQFGQLNSGDEGLTVSWHSSVTGYNILWKKLLTIRPTRI